MSERTFAEVLQEEYVDKQRQRSDERRGGTYGAAVAAAMPSPPRTKAEEAEHAERMQAAREAVRSSDGPHAVYHQNGEVLGRLVPSELRGGALIVALGHSHEPLARVLEAYPDARVAPAPGDE